MFDDAVRKSDYDRMRVNNELERMWKETAVA
jgi:hypothetical protein